MMVATQMKTTYCITSKWDSQDFSSSIGSSICFLPIRPRVISSGRMPMLFEV